MSPFDTKAVGAAPKNIPVGATLKPGAAPVGGGLPADVMGVGPEKAEASLGKVRDLLQQAMDMIGELETKEAPAIGAGMPPPPERRPPMRPRPGAPPVMP